MSVHSMYVHVTFIQLSNSQLVHVLLTSAFEPLLWKTVCDCLYHWKALAFDSQTLDTDHQGALLTFARTKVLPQ